MQFWKLRVENKFAAMELFRRQIRHVEILVGREKFEEKTLFLLHKSDKRRSKLSAEASVISTESSFRPRLPHLPLVDNHDYRHLASCLKLIGVPDGEKLIHAACEFE